MPAVVTDIVDGAVLRQDTLGVNVTRIFYVKGLVDEEGNLPADGGVLQDALNALTDSNGSVTINTPHPNYPTLLARDFSAEPVEGDSGTVKVTVNYGLPDGSITTPEINIPQITVGGTVEQVTSRVDHQFNPLKVFFIPPGTTEQQEFIGETSLSVPRFTRRATVREQGQTLSPEAKAVACLGKVNTGTIWGGSGPRTWLCSELNATLVTQPDPGDASTWIWDVNYAFVYNPVNWDITLVYIDKQGNVPDGIPTDAVLTGEGNGWKSFQVYEEADFAILGLGT